MSELKKKDLGYLVEAAMIEYLSEQRKKDIKLVINGKEIPYGSPSHLVDMRKTLEGLERTRDCYEKGSSSRMVFSQACSRIKKILEDLTMKHEKAAMAEASAIPVL